MKKIVGLVAIIVGVFIIGSIMYLHSPFATTTRVFSPYSLLLSSGDYYKRKFINQDGRVIDFSQNQVTTSEGQSYAMLRSVWVDDKATFDFVWNWTQHNLQLPNGLFGWQWGRRQNGTYGFLSGGGNNSATDADSDIAFSLLMASKRWHNDTYNQQAKKILNALWNTETATASGKRYLVAGPWAVTSNTLVINPSYFAPYEWRVFAKVDHAHDWDSLIHPAYELLTRASNSPLDKSSGVGLPPDWIEINRKKGNISAATLSQLTTNYAYDAMRIPWRIGLDYEWNHDEQAKKYLANLNFLQKEYSNTGMLAGTYSHDGTPLQNEEIPSMYATALGYFLVIQPHLAQKIYQDKIIKLYSNDQNTFLERLGYYDQNWLWFGAALYNHFLVNYF